MKNVLENFKEFFLYEKGVYKFVNPFYKKKPLLYLDNTYISVPNYYIEIEFEITYVYILIFEDWKTLVSYFKKNKIMKNTMVVVLGDIYEEEKIKKLKRKISIYKKKITIVVSDSFLSNILILKIVNTLVLNSKYKVGIKEEKFTLSNEEECIELTNYIENITLTLLRQKMRKNIPLKLKKMKNEK